MGQPREDDEAFLAVEPRDRELVDFLAGAVFFAGAAFLAGAVFFAAPDLLDELVFFAGAAFLAVEPRLADAVFFAGLFLAAAVFLAGARLLAPCPEPESSSFSTTFESWISPSQPSTSS